MSLTSEPRNPVWNLSKSAYDEINDWPFMRNPEPILMILAAYLLFVLKLGPAFMRKREAFKLTYTMALYNAIQVVFSFVLVCRYFKEELRRGFLGRTCHMENDAERAEILISIWWYFVAKLTELLDTIFFVLRKKDNQVTFLHLYHHSVMLIGSWAVLKYYPSHTIGFIGLTNSSIHVIMYSYYGLAAFGTRFEKYLKWKKYITSLQLVQFVSIIIHYLVSVKICDCPPTKGFAAFIALNTTFFLVLFLNFYIQSYSTKRVKRTIHKSQEKQANKSD